jgi:hypothetical protein
LLTCPHSPDAPKKKRTTARKKLKSPRKFEGPPSADEVATELITAQLMEIEALKLRIKAYEAEKTAAKAKAVAENARRIATEARRAATEARKAAEEGHRSAEVVQRASTNDACREVKRAVEVQDDGRKRVHGGSVKLSKISLLR